MMMLMISKWWWRCVDYETEIAIGIGCDDEWASDDDDDDDDDAGNDECDFVRMNW